MINSKETYVKKVRSHISNSGYNRLNMLLRRYQVDITMDFKVNSWSKQEQEEFKKSMITMGYKESFIKTYY